MRLDPTPSAVGSSHAFRVMPSGLAGVPGLIAPTLVAGTPWQPLAALRGTTARRPRSVTVTTDNDPGSSPNPAASGSTGLTRTGFRRSLRAETPTDNGILRSCGDPVRTRPRRNDGSCRVAADRPIHQARGPGAVGPFALGATCSQSGTSCQRPSVAVRSSRAQRVGPAIGKESRQQQTVSLCNYLGRFSGLMTCAVGKPRMINGFCLGPVNSSQSAHTFARWGTVSVKKAQELAKAPSQRPQPQ